MEGSSGRRGEWTSEGEQNDKVCEPERSLRYKISICLYAMSGYLNTKPGGTAGVLLLSLQKELWETGVFFYARIPVSQSRIWKMKGETK